MLLIRRWRGRLMIGFDGRKSRNLRRNPRVRNLRRLRGGFLDSRIWRRPRTEGFLDSLNRRILIRRIHRRGENLRNGSYWMMGFGFDLPLTPRTLSSPIRLGGRNP